MELPLGLSFNDVLLIPQYSEIDSRSHINLQTKLTKNIKINIPLISSNMDTVTEDKMCIAMARNGGIGILHRYCSIDEQVEMVKKVKRAESFIIKNPYTADKNDTIKDIKEKIKEFQISSYLIIENNKLIGLLTNRDIHFRKDNELVESCMTPFDKLITTDNPNISVENAKNIMLENKIQKLPIVDALCQLIGLVCLKDISRIEQRPLATLDKLGRLMCGAAIGVKEQDMERATKLVEAGVDLLVIDVAHGDTKICIEQLKKCKKNFDIDIIAGNISTKEAAQNLIKAGADGIKVGQGNGCFASGTRILLANGKYKNIEDIKINDYVINMDGKPVRVINAFSTGLKQIIKLKTTSFYKPTYVTKDHLYYIQDSEKIFQEIGKCNIIHTSLLTPKNIQWQLPDYIIIHLNNNQIIADYNIAYIFIKYIINGFINETEDDRIYWRFNSKEYNIINKIKNCIFNIIVDTDINITNTDNDVILSIYCKDLVDIMKTFILDNNRHLPNKYYCLSREYLKGLFDGFMDIENKFIVNMELIELFNWIGLILNQTNKNEEYICSYIIEKSDLNLIEQVYDITVDCPTHSFIANGVIVHNSICTTRLVAGAGLPQFTALQQVCQIAQDYDIPVISDGGNRTYGNIAKAIGIGANSIMLGRMIAGTNETPMQIIIKDSKRVKMIRGMAGRVSNISNAERQNIDTPDLNKFTPEGVEAYVPAIGSVSDILVQICNSIRSGMSYTGAKNIGEFHKKAKFIRLTENSIIESGVHDVTQI